VVAALLNTIDKLYPVYLSYEILDNPFTVNIFLLLFKLTLETEVEFNVTDLILTPVSRVNPATKISWKWLCTDPVTSVW